MMQGKNQTATDEITIVTGELGKRVYEPGLGCLVVLYGDNIGWRYSLDTRETIIGRSGKSQLQINHNSVSRQHAKIITESGQSKLRDMGSTNGTYVNDVLVDEIALGDGDLLRVGTTILKFLCGTNIESKYHEEIYRLTTVDGLTEVCNKRYFLESLDRELNRSARYKRPMSLVMCDIDHFKVVNDTKGHLAGDHILRHLAALLKKNLRREDILARYGGEEFAIIFPEVSNQGAQTVSEKLRKVIETHDFEFSGHTIRVTISMGIATTVGLSKAPSAEEFIGEADAKLYQAKHGGRNRVCA